MPHPQYPDWSSPAEQQRLQALLARLEHGPLDQFTAQRLGLGFLPPLLAKLQEQGHIILTHKLSLHDHKRVTHEVSTYYLSTKTYGVDEEAA